MTRLLRKFPLVVIRTEKNILPCFDVLYYKRKEIIDFVE